MNIYTKSYFATPVIVVLWNIKTLYASINIEFILDPAICVSDCVTYVLIYYLSSFRQKVADYLRLQACTTAVFLFVTSSLYINKQYGYQDSILFLEQFTVNFIEKTIF